MSRRRQCLNRITEPGENDGQDYAAGCMPTLWGAEATGQHDVYRDVGSGVVVVRNVKATICSQCGEEWIDNDTAQELENIVTEAREKRLQVEVTTL